MQYFSIAPSGTFRSRASVVARTAASFLIFCGLAGFAGCNLNLLPGLLSQEEDAQISDSVLLAAVINAYNSSKPATNSFPIKALDSNSASFDCSTTFFTSSTTSAVNNTPLDLRFYIHDFKLVDWNGGTTSTPLTTDGVWQASGAALLDFETGADNCAGGSGSGTTATNESVTIAVPAGSWQGVEFTVGLPYALQRQNASSSETGAPFNVTAMYWSWTAGYKFIKMEWNDGGGNFIRYHLGSTNCTTDATGAQASCAEENRATVRLTHAEGFDPTADSLQLSIPGLMNGFPGDAGGAQTCMPQQSGTNCQTLLGNTGVNSGDGSSTGTSAMFSIQKGR